MLHGIGEIQAHCSVGRLPDACRARTARMSATSCADGSNGVCTAFAVRGDAGACVIAEIDTPAATTAAYPQTARQSSWASRFLEVNLP